MVAILDNTERELEDLPRDMQWREWMNRIEAVIFASPEPVARDTLQQIIGQGVNIDLLIGDIQSELKGRPYELVQVGGAWTHRTRAQYASVIKTATELQSQELGFTELEMAVLATIAYQQPISRARLADAFGKDVDRDIIARLRHKKLIANGPRSPGPGAAHTFVTTSQFLLMFDLKSLRDLPESEDLE